MVLKNAYINKKEMIQHRAVRCIFNDYNCTSSVSSMLNIFESERIFHCYQLDQSVSILRVFGWYFAILFRFE